MDQSHDTFRGGRQMFLDGVHGAKVDSVPDTVSVARGAQTGGESCDDQCLQREAKQNHVVGLSEALLGVSTIKGMDTVGCANLALMTTLKLFNRSVAWPRQHCYQPTEFVSEQAREKHRDR